MLLVIDNYDSFTYNLVHYAQELGAKTHIVRNDDISVDQALELRQGRPTFTWALHTK